MYYRFHSLRKLIAKSKIVRGRGVGGHFEKLELCVTILIISYLCHIFFETLGRILFAEKNVQIARKTETTLFHTNYRTIFLEESLSVHLVLFINLTIRLLHTNMI